MAQWSQLLRYFPDSIGVERKKSHIRIVRGYEITVTFETLSANDINFGATDLQTAPQPPAPWLYLS